MRPVNNVGTCLVGELSRAFPLLDHRVEHVAQTYNCVHAQYLPVL